jgi:hypothetical protein
MVGTTTSGRVRHGVSRRIWGMAADSGTIPETATAVVLNITALGALWPTDVTGSPEGASGSHVEPTSSINVRPGQVVPNLVTSQLGYDGWVHVTLNAPTPPSDGRPAYVVIDLVGYYDSTSAGHRFQESPPARILETRASQGGPVGQATARRVGAGGVIDLTVRGSVPTRGGGTVQVPEDAAAVVLQVTATGATESTDVRVYPTGLPAVPTISNLNVPRGGTSSNLVMAKVGPDGQVRLRNSAGSVDLVADLAGWFSPTAPGLFVPATPRRLLDTRFGVGAAPIRTTPGGLVDLLFRPSGRSAPVRAVAMNLTGVGSSAGTDVRAYAPETGSVPEVSNLNLRAAETRANAVLVGVGDSSVVRLRNAAGSLHLISDVVGWFEG